MKKVVGFILLFAVMMNSSALAEVFTLHNGTQFGMSKEEVIELEKANGFVLEELSPSEGFERLMGKGTIASQPNSSVWYFFDTNGSLIRMNYLFPDGKTFDSIEDSLNKKYGETQYSSETNLEFPHLYDSKYASSKIPFTSHSDGQLFANERTDYSHRLVEADNGEYIFIEHYVDLDKYWKSDSQYLKYHLLTSEDVAKINGNTTQIDDDL